MLCDACHLRAADGGEVRRVAEEHPPSAPQVFVEGLYAAKAAVGGEVRDQVSQAEAGAGLDGGGGADGGAAEKRIEPLSAIWM